MQRPSSQQEPWAIRLPGDEATRRAGENLREWAGDQRSPLRRFLGRLTLRDERDPKLAGAWGEEVVAKELAKLGEGREVVSWLTRRPVVLPADAVRRIAHAARHPSTWDPTKVAQILDRQPAPAAVPGTEPDAVAPAAAGRRVTVVRWRRYGHDRLYVNDVEAGERLGWRDELSGGVHVEDGIDPSVVHQALERARSQGSGSA